MSNISKAKEAIEFNTELNSFIDNYITENGIPNQLNETADFFSELDNKIGLIFSVDTRCDRTETDYWLQCEYWSGKLTKTIIFDYDFQHRFKTKEELLNIILGTTKNIKKFEDNITIKK